MKTVFPSHNKAILLLGLTYFWVVLLAIGYRLLVISYRVHGKISCGITPTLRLVTDDSSAGSEASLNDLRASLVTGDC